MRVLVTRPEPGAARTAETLRDRGHEPVVLPLSRIVKVTPNPVPSTLGFLAVVFTSANAVTHMPAGLHQRLAELPCYVVGSRTAGQAAALGFDVVGIATDTVELTRMLTGAFLPGDSLAYVCGRVRKPSLESDLGAANLRITPIEVYDTLKISYPTDSIIEKIASPNIDAILVYSTVSAIQIRDYMTSPEIADIVMKSKICCLSDRIASEFSQLDRLRVRTSEAPDEDSLLELIG